MLKRKQLNLTTLFKVTTNYWNWLLQLQYSMVASTIIPNSYYNQKIEYSELQTK